MDAENEQINKIVESWTKSKKKLGGLLVEQSFICGIGIAYGSEILYDAGLKPDIKANEQNLSKLSQSIINVRNKIKQHYIEELDKCNNLKEFINKWFYNLYEIREMNIYKKGTKIDVLGRTWWM